MEETSVHWSHGRRPPPAGRGRARPADVERAQFFFSSIAFARFSARFLRIMAVSAAMLA
jgi:hypothetical protein